MSLTKSEKKLAIEILDGKEKKHCGGEIYTHEEKLKMLGWMLEGLIEEGRVKEILAVLDMANKMQGHYAPSQVVNTNISKDIEEVRALTDKYLAEGTCDYRRFSQTSAN